MKKTILATTIIIALTTTPALAKSNTSYPAKEAAGFGTGLVAGAIVGGPLGAVIGATFGALIGHSKGNEQTIQNLDTELLLSKKQITTINHQNNALAQSLNQLKNENIALNEKVSLATQSLAANDALEQIKLNLQFKSGSSDISPLYRSQIDKIAELLKQNKQLNIALAGFADRHGDEDINYQLSNNRADAVKNALMQQGINPHRIRVQAYGNTALHPLPADHQNDFFERRVEIILQPKNLLTAAND